MKRFQHVPTSRIVAALLLVVVILTGAVLAVGAVRLIDIDRSIERARTGLSASSASLTAAEIHWMAWDSANTAIAAGDLQAMGIAVAEGAAAGADWNRYLQTAVGLPGEAAAQADYALAVDRFNATIASATAAVQDSGSAEVLHSLYLGLVQPINVLRPLYQSALSGVVSSAHTKIAATQRDTVATGIVALAIVTVLAALVLRIIRRRERGDAVRDREQLRVARRGELETRLQRALSLVGSEDASYRLIERALHMAAPDVPAELLVADSSRAHFRQVAATDEHRHGCAVSSPMDCPAITRGQTQVWSSSTELDACPWLADHGDGACSSTCVPVSIAGKTVGVLRAIGPDGAPPARTAIDDLELVARKAGERVGMLRAFSRSETQARTDALTGLFNRRSLEAKLREITDDGEPYVIAFGDLDHFKLLNDVHGHDAGDRALRMFARVIRDSVRPNDITARYGGEEFIVVLPDCSVADALAVLERVRVRLAATQTDGTVPSFTVSFGVATSRPDLPYSETIDTADEALLRAKAAGRDRIIVAGGSEGDAHGPPQATSTQDGVRQLAEEQTTTSSTS